MQEILPADPAGPKNRDHLWKPGQSGNLSGRKKGSRNRLCNAYFDDMLADWQEHGKEAIAAFRTQRPHEYVRVIGALMPREFNVQVNEIEEMSDGEIAAQLGPLLRELMADGLGALAGIEIAERAEPAAPVPALPEAGQLP